jgi:hypothetical protein
MQAPVIEDAPHAPTWIKYIVISRVVDSMTTRTRRVLFGLMRKTHWCTHDTFFPQFGLTAGEFCTFHALLQTRRQR